MRRVARALARATGWLAAGTAFSFVTCIAAVLIQTALEVPRSAFSRPLFMPTTRWGWPPEPGWPDPFGRQTEESWAWRREQWQAPIATGGHWQAEDAAGWPLRAWHARSEGVLDPPRGPRVHDLGLGFGLELPGLLEVPALKRLVPGGGWSVRQARVPMVPNGWRFIASVGIHAGVLVVGFGAAGRVWGAVRARARRRGWGGCEGCGYPVSGMSVCPECGRAVDR